MNRPVNRQIVLLLAIVLAASSCSVVGHGPEAVGPSERPTVDRPPPGELPVERDYGGSVTFSGNRISLVLHLSGVGDEYSAELQIPDLDLEASGTATIQGDYLSVDLSYAGECPGRLSLTGRLRERERRIEGRLTASDCTGEEDGVVVLLLRPSG
jgi:hypothetical protein